MTGSTSIAERVQKAFPPAIQNIIIEALRVAYRNASDIHDPSIGCDGLTFGISVYTFACFELANRLSSVEGVMPISRYPTFRLGIGGFVTGCHRIGDDEGSPIDETFPPNQHAAGHLRLPQQMTLPFGGREEILPGGLVIAHLGNPEIGLAAVYLAMPDTVDEQDRINGWRYTQRLWTRGSGDGERAPIQVDLPAEEVIAPPSIGRKPRAGGSA